MDNTVRYGKKLDPERANRVQNIATSKRTYVRITNNPETISPGKTLRLTFPSLEEADIVSPGTARLSFKLGVTKDCIPKNNICRSILKQIRITISGKELYNLNRPDVFYDYLDRWRSR